MQSEKGLIEDTLLQVSLPGRHVLSREELHYPVDAIETEVDDIRRRYREDMIERLVVFVSGHIRESAVFDVLPSGATDAS